MLVDGPIGIAEAAVQGLNEFLGCAGISEAAGHGAHALEISCIFRALFCDFVESLVLYDAPARHVALLRLAFAPCGGDLQAQHIVSCRLAQLQPVPGIFRSRIVDVRIEQIIMLFIEPGEPSFAFQLVVHLWIDVAQMGDVSQGVLKLGIRQWAAAPIGEPRGFIQAALEHLLDERVVRDRIAVTAGHRCNLRVEHRMRKLAADLEENF